MNRIPLIQILLALGFSAILSANALAGSVSGTVKFNGTPPTFKPLKMDADPVCMAAHKEDVFPQTLVLGEGQTMGNVFVYITNAPAGDYKAPTEPLVIDQKGCNYIPHVAAVMVNQPVKILNPDGTLHNVHILSKTNPEANLAMPKFRTEISRSFEKAESMFALKCDVHPWMGAWVAVMSNPFFAVTGADGKFVIKDLPDGSYTLQAWHEKLGIQTAAITVAGGEVTNDFTFSAPNQS